MWNRNNSHERLLSAIYQHIWSMAVVGQKDNNYYDSLVGYIRKRVGNSEIVVLREKCWFIKSRESILTTAKADLTLILASWAFIFNNFCMQLMCKLISIVSNSENRGTVNWQKLKNQQKQKSLSKCAGRNMQDFWCCAEHVTT